MIIRKNYVYYKYMKILFLSNRVPHSEVAGSHKLIYRRMIRLKQKGHYIGLACLCSEEESKYVSNLTSSFDEIEIIDNKKRTLLFRLLNDYINPSLPAIFWKNRSKYMMKKVGDMVDKNNYDLVIAEFGEMGQYLYKNPYLSAVHKIVSCHRCLTDTFRKYVSISGVPLSIKLKSSIQLNRLMKYEFEMYSAMDHILTLTDEDRFSLLRYAPQLPVSVIPPGINLKELNNVNIKNKPDYPLLMMCGYFTNKSNRDAALWFIRNVWPIIRKRCPSARCWFVGNGIDSVMQQTNYHKSGITMINNIDDLTPYRKLASIFINPIRLGSGLSIKILEAMGVGLPVVTTSLGAAGIPAQNGVNCFINNSPKGFADSIIWLIQDTKLAKLIGENAKYMVSSRYDINLCIKQLESICTDTISLSKMKKRSA